MAILLSVQGISKSFGSSLLFEDLSFGIESGERIGLIGPNGAGKSTLLKILAERESADHGEIIRSRGLKVGYLEQDPSFHSDASIFSAVAAGAGDDPERLGVVHEWLARLTILGDGRDDDTPVARLSGGWKKRVALARELVREPDLLILDEPTNHLDLESILWLEDLLVSSPFATLTVTHDRMFLERIATRILDLDRRNPGGIFSVTGGYADYLEAKEAMLAAQARREEIVRNTLRRETEWLRRGAKARTTKQTARINRAGDLEREAGDLATRNQSRTAKIDFQSAEGRSPRRLIEATGLSHGYGGRRLFSPVDLLITPKSRVGLLGANGCGKTTLIKLLLGSEKPQSGEVKINDRIRVAYFAQHRVELDPKVSVLKTICPDGDYVEFRGQRIFVRGYLGRFLFRTEQMDMPVEKLSGGEKARLRLASLMLEPADVLVLDEPTNDLDLPTLNVLEQALLDFEGAVILVTHDRYFLDQVANEILAFVQDDSAGPRIERFADTLQWEDWVRSQKREAKPVSRSEAATAQEIATAPKAKRKLSYKDQRELDGMEARILEAEGRLESLKVEIARPENASDAAKLTRLTTELAETEALVEKLYARWAELSG